MNASMPMRIVMGASGVWVAACVAFVVWNGVRNPMAARNRALEERLSSIHFSGDDLPEPDKAPLKDQREAITKKAAVWKALVAPPVAPEATPDLTEKLKGVQVTRQQIMKGDGVNVRYRLSIDDKQSRWLSVGTVVNGVTVKEIRPDAVVFSLKQNGKEYTAELPRK